MNHPVHEDTESTGFSYRNGHLFCEEVAVEELAEKIKTPFYLYSYRTLNDRFKEFDRSFETVPHLICFAVKANGNLAILRAFAREGAGAEVVSAGELFRAMKAGIKTEKIVFGGVGKRVDEIEMALEEKVLMLSVESHPELKLINKIAKKRKVIASVALRINPDIDPRTHHYIATGLKGSKFGIPMNRALNEYRKAAGMKHVSVVGIHMHLGSQILEVEPFLVATQRLLALLEILNEDGIRIRYLDLGGGLGIPYKNERPPTPDEFAAAILPLVKDWSLELILEPGRALIGKAGALITRVLYVKRKSSHGFKNFIIVDAGMNDLIRPCLYGAYHEILCVQEKKGSFVADVVGPVCETADFFATDREVPKVREGDLLAIMDVGAYGFCMASNYNARPRPAEVMVRGNQYFLIREREKLGDLIRGEQIPPFLR